MELRKYSGAQLMISAILISRSLRFAHSLILLFYDHDSLIDYIACHLLYVPVPLFIIIIIIIIICIVYEQNMIPM